MGIFSNSWRTSVGKVSQTYGMYSRKWRRLLEADPTIDYTRNDYDLYRSLYYAVSINRKAQDMLVAAMFAKPIINSAAGFVLSGIPTVTFSSDVANKEELEENINELLQENKSEIISYVIHGLRDGDSYWYVDEFGNIEELDADTVEIVLDPQTGITIGYDVVENVVERQPDGTEEKWTILKQYRTDSVKYTRYPTQEFNQQQRPKGTVLYNKVYTTEGAITPTENQQFLQEQIIERPLPIIHFGNDIEPRGVYGNSELLNCLVGFKQYHAIMTNATKGIINSAHPVPYVIGGKSPKDIRNQPANDPNWDNDNPDKVDWSPDNILFFDNPDAKIGYAQANGMMTDVSQILEYYFLLIIQASETPEFVFGGAVKSSMASVKEQMPVVLQKAERKRSQLQQPFQNLVKSYIDRRIRLSDPLFLPLKNKSYDLTIQFPDIIDEDKQLTLSTVQFLVTEGLISDKTALATLMGDKIPDVETEIELARTDSEDKMKKAQEVMQQQENNRLENEADNSKQDTKDTQRSEKGRVQETFLDQLRQVTSEIYKPGQKRDTSTGKWTAGLTGASHITDLQSLKNNPKAPTIVAEQLKLNKKPSEKEVNAIIQNAMSKDEYARYQKDIADVNKKIKQGKTSEEIYGVDFNDGRATVYNSNRLKLHNEIMFEYQKRATLDVKTTQPPKMLVIMGRPGSGKSSYQIKGKNPTDWAVWSDETHLVIDPDEIKTMLGSKPNDVALYHEESSYLSKKILDMAVNLKTNIAYDQTLASDKTSKIQAFKDFGYEISAVGVSTSIPVSLNNAAKRYAEPISETGKTGRLVLPEVSLSNTTNEANFEKIIPLTDGKWAYHVGQIETTDKFGFTEVAKGENY